MEVCMKENGCTTMPMGSECLEIRKETSTKGSGDGTNRTGKERKFGETEVAMKENIVMEFGLAGESIE